MRLALRHDVVGESLALLGALALGAPSALSHRHSVRGMRTNLVVRKLLRKCLLCICHLLGSGAAALLRKAHGE